jgi:small ligand-binding sensory domain FIST
MIHAGVGQSSSESSEQAAGQAAAAAMQQAGISRADLAVLFLTVDHLPNYQQIVTVLTRLCGTNRIVGSSGAGVLTGEGETEGIHGLAVLVVAASEIKGDPFLFQPVRGRDKEVGDQIASVIESHAEENSHLILFPDSYNSRPDRLFAALENRIGFLPVVGAGSSENGALGATYQFCNEQISTNGVAGLHLSGKFRSSVEFTQGCQPITAPMVITKAERNLIYEIDHRPAFEVFSGVIKGPLSEDLRRALTLVFVGLPADRNQRNLTPGNYLVRNIIGLDPAKGILGISEEVREGLPIVFTVRDPQRAREDLNQMLQRQAANLEGRSPTFGFYFNCCARGSSLYGMPGLDTAYIRQSLGQFPLIGLFGGFELAPLSRKNHLLAYTGVLVLISDAG